jgi:ankyrin repeat domain-containing protein 50
VLSWDCSSTIIEAVKADCCSTQTAITFFYFDFSNPEKQCYDIFICSLIVQLSPQSNDTSKTLEKLYQHCGQGIQPPSTDQLEKALEKIITVFQNVYILLDTLDECSEREQFWSGS